MSATHIDQLDGSVSTVDLLEVRVVKAMLECIARWGIAKTTVDDIARAAGISRATLYRAFPGGKDVLFDAMLRHEAARLFRTVTARLDAAESLADLLVIGVVEATAFLRHHEALTRVMAQEPELVLPAFAFHRLDRALDIAVGFTTPHLVPFVVDAEAARSGAEWVVRLLLSYVMNPSPQLDLADPASVRQFVQTYVLPVLQPSYIAPKEH